MTNSARQETWVYDCPCDFRHPQSRMSLPGQYHEEGCYKRVSPQVEAYMVALEAKVEALEGERDQALRLAENWMRAAEAAVKQRYPGLTDSPLHSLTQDAQGREG